MENKIEILKELQEISPLLTEASRKNIYSIAPIYFDKLAEEIMDKISFDANTMHTFTRVNPYTVQSEYFENFSGTVLQKIGKSELQPNEITGELNEVAPFLNTISKTPVYRVPQGYFNELQPSAERATPKAKVIKFYTTLTKYAAAAAITGLLAVGSYMMIDGEPASLQAKGDNTVSQEVKRLKDDEIIDFLETQASPNITSAMSNKLSPAREIKQQLKEMTDEELQQYLKENQEPGEIEVDI